MSVYAYSSKSSCGSYIHPSTPVSYSSWGTLTPPPSTPYSAPVPLPTCCPPTPTSPAPSYYSVVPHPPRSPDVHPIFRRITFDLRSAPPPASQSSMEPATNPPTSSMNLLLVPPTSVPLPPHALQLSSPHPSQPISVSTLLEFLYRSLHAPLSHQKMQALGEAMQIVNCAYERRGKRGRIGEGVRIGDRLGGSWVVLNLYPNPAERGQWVVNMGFPTTA